MRKELSSSNNNNNSESATNTSRVEGGKSDFVNIFGNINRGSSNQETGYNQFEEEDQEMGEDEKDILK